MTSQAGCTRSGARTGRDLLGPVGLCTVLVLVSLAASGCSARQSEPILGPEAAAAADFASDYTAITAAHQERVDETRARGQGALEEGPTAVLQIYRDLLSLSEDAYAEYEALAPPEALAEEHERLVDNLGRQSTALRGILDAAQTEDDAALTANLEKLADALLEWGRTNQLIAQQLAIDG